MEDLLSQLHDIKGIDGVSWWPLAPAWWGGAALICICCASFVFYRIYRRRKMASWQVHAKELFAEVRGKEDSKKKAAGISELLRRLAMQKYGRDACAGLEGSEWLAWLAEHDPDGFDWSKEAGILNEVLYAPTGVSTKGDGLDKLIDAAERWVK